MKDNDAKSEIPCLDGESGQVEAETAIVLPAVVFLLLGLIQMGLISQARVFAKVSAYRAVRTGALRAVKLDLMEKAAVAAALPVLAYRSGNADTLGRTDTATNWMRKWARPGFGMMPSNRMVDAPMLQYVEVTVCGPTQGDVQAGVYNAEGGGRVVAFDNVDISSKGITTKLRVRTTLNYRMFIPFANWVIYRMWRGKKITKELRLDARKFVMPGMNFDRYEQAAQLGVYVVPIQSFYSMKLHSDVPIDRLPQDANVCDGAAI